MFAEQFKANFATRLTAITAATSIDDLFQRLEASGNLLRLDPAVRPTMYRCAIVSRAELDQLRRINDVVRMGRVDRIEPDRIVLDGGTIPADRGALYIDCTADGLQQRPPTPIFDTDRITLQSVRGCQQVFSAAFIAHVEAAGYDDELNNDLCTPVPNPDSDLDWLRVTIAEQRNQMRWFDEPEQMSWLDSARLNLLGDMYSPLMANPQLRQKMFGMLTATLKAANEKLETLLSHNASAAARQAGMGASPDVTSQ